jgi:hypothetical protein
MIFSENRYPLFGIMLNAHGAFFIAPARLAVIGGVARAPGGDGIKSLKSADEIQAAVKPSIGT